MTKRKPIKLWAFKGKTLNWVHITCSSDVLPAEGSGLEKVQALGIEWGGFVPHTVVFVYR